MALKNEGDASLSPTASDVAVSPRRVTVLGSTGSVGCNTIDLLQRQPENYFVEALTAHRNVERLAEQARLVRARLAVIGMAEALARLKPDVVVLWGDRYESLAAAQASLAK